MSEAAKIDVTKQGAEFWCSLTVGVQHFRVGLGWDTQEEADFMAHMLRLALLAAECPQVIGGELADVNQQIHSIFDQRNKALIDSKDEFLRQLKKDE